ncbi:MAG: PfkB family carbohydrate kinase [bacterium]
MSILVVGSVALDNVETPFGQGKDLLGGSATYFSYAASYFTKVKMIAIIGEDFPKEYVEILQKRDIDIQGLEKKSGKTFRWSGKYDYDLSNRETLAVELNVFSDFHPHIPESYKDSKTLFLANIDPDLQDEILNQIKRPNLVICDTMDHWIQNKKNSIIKLLKKIDILMLNEGELRQLCEEHNIIKCIRSILQSGIKIVVVKKGEHGVVIVSKDFHFATIGYPLEDVYDPTGAGDVFGGGFAGYLDKKNDISEDNLKRAVIYGSVMASFNVEDFSLNRLLTLTNDEIEYRFKEFKKLTHFEEV